MLSNLAHRIHHFAFGVVFRLSFALAPSCLRDTYNEALHIGLAVISGDLLGDPNFPDLDLEDED